MNHGHGHGHDHHHDHSEMAAIRSRLRDVKGPQFWRSLEELAGTDAFQDFLGREFPSQADEWTDPVGRRQFLRVMGASLALAGVSGCAFQPPETIVPYVKAPEEIVAGKPLFFATALTLGGYASGVLVESWAGRPTKIEGNPDHPATLGGTDAQMQAAVLSLYDPDRSQVVTHNGRISTWDDFLGVVIDLRDLHNADDGAGLRLLTGCVTSPTLVAQMKGLKAEFPAAQWHQYEPAGRDNVREGARLAFGEPVEPIYHFDRADVILSLDSDFTFEGPSHLRDARLFASRRDPDTHPRGLKMNRLYVAEPTPTCTGSIADHRLPLSSRAVGLLANAVAEGVEAFTKDPVVAGVALSEPAANFAKAVVDDLKAHRGSSLVLVGLGQPRAVHRLGYAMNVALGNVGKTVEFIEPVVTKGDAGLEELIADLNDGKVATLVILGGNPAYDAPIDFNVRAAILKAKTTIRLGSHEDETSSLCHWHLPEADPLETWGDALAYDGTATIIQPLISPLYGGRSAIEVLATMATGETKTGLDLVKSTWKTRRPGDGFDKFWTKALRDGFVAGSASTPKPVTFRQIDLPGRLVRPSEAAGLELIFRADPTVHDGRFANNGWLQELPKPITRINWDNAAIIAPATAGKLGLKVDELYGNADVVELKRGGRTLRIPIWILPGQAEDTITVHLGYGRTKAGRVGTGAGFDAYTIRTSDAPWAVSGLEVAKTSERFRIATVQHHQNMEGRELVRVGTVDEYKKDPNRAQEPDKHVTPGLTLYEPPLPQLNRQNGEGNSWGMAINLNQCIGCNACMVACQSENNIPVVGKDQVLAGRAMHWIRIDRYFEGDVDDPSIHHQPVPCMHCEAAPCELVCPVAATSHSAEGLNEMTYNRCVGTRYCGNNCPYKVRRFNFLQYSDETTPSLKLLNNPDVTVRSRGVMEKCSYCVQRISAARIIAEGENRQVGGNEVVTACQSACPTRAIVFGNLNDREADVVKAKASPRNYALLAELNTRPRTTYLAKVTNPNPALEEG